MPARKLPHAVALSAGLSVWLTAGLSVGLTVVALAAGPADQRPTTDTGRLDHLAATARAEWAAQRGAAWAALHARDHGPMARLLATPGVDLVGLGERGRPLVLVTHNVAAAASVSTDAVWPGGWTGLELAGDGPAGEMALWDGGVVRITHQEFGGRVTIADGQTNVIDHATHVAGTMIAAGIDPAARGMSLAGRVDSYFWDQDEAEMAAAAAAGLRLSNHSYGWAAGWHHGAGGEDAWYWFGTPAISETEDPGFGFYSAGSADWDAIAHAAPGYLIVKSAGNDRDDAGPGAGAGHYIWDQAVGDWVWSTTARDPDGGDDGFDTIPYRGNSKNVLTVGAVHDVPGGWSLPADVQASAFTGWGPTDDGRIKPDLVANGVTLYSPLAGADDEYGSFSGTSMSAPSVTGSLNLILQQYKALQGAAPLASTLKAVALHTASESGPGWGPDYMFGWGLLNTAAAALLVADHADGGARITEAVLTAGATDEYLMYHAGSGKLKVTVAWTDPAGDPPAWSLDPTDPVLVNDLELRIERVEDATVFLPWVLDPANPALAATTGVNFRDNVEQVDATGAGAGLYRVTVGHAGPLTGTQAYSLIQTGLQPVPTSAPDVVRATGARLIGAAPNPFNPRTEVALSLARGGPARVEVFDPRGRRVAVLHDGDLAAGEHRLAWDGRDQAGQPAAAGVYLVRLRAAQGADVLRIALVK